LKSKLFIRITLPWPGEKDLGQPMEKKKITNKDIMNEIRKEHKDGTDSKN